MAQNSNHRCNRRDLIKGGAVVAATAIVGFPFVSRAQNKPIKIGMPTIQSGRAAMVGSSSRNGCMLEIDKFNAAGGLGGRMIELVARDTKGKPEEAARLSRELVNSDGCEILFDAESSAGAFAIHEVAKDLGVVVMHMNTETSSLTADPKLRIPNAFRASRQGIHDSIAAGSYAGKIAKAKGLKKWLSCSPDYAYGRDSTQLFFEYLKHFQPDVELVGEAWPKLYQPDYTDALTKILQIKPQAMYSCLWGGDLTAFIDQSAIYNLFAQMEVFTINVADYTILTAVKNLPKGIHSGNRYLSTFPKTEANAKWAADYRAKFNEFPVNWSWENATGTKFVIEGLKKAGSTEAKQLSDAIRGMKIESPFGADGTLTMRAEDQTLVNYATGWGQTIPTDPFMPEVTPIDWQVIYELETAWKKKNNYI
jgi:branched-chain amino acid transport system substrate-binding protein